MIWGPLSSRSIIASFLGTISVMISLEWLKFSCFFVDFAVSYFWWWNRLSQRTQQQLTVQAFSQELLPFNILQSSQIFILKLTFSRFLNKPFHVFTLVLRVLQSKSQSGGSEGKSGSHTAWWWKRTLNPTWKDARGSVIPAKSRRDWRRARKVTSWPHGSWDSTTNRPCLNKV